jgi:hypothetical protein
LNEKTSIEDFRGFKVLFCVQVQLSVHGWFIGGCG